MAKITAPFLGLAASGTIGKTLTASKWRGRPYIRTRVVPSNPQTAAQSQTRDVFAWANNVWKRAPTLFVTPWDRFAEGQVLTGRNAMQGNAVRTLRGDADLTDYEWTIGAKGGIPPVSVTATPGGNSATVDFVVPATPTGWTLFSAIAAVIRDQDPATGNLFTMTAGEDLVPGYQVVLAGLTTGVLYSVGGWLRWTKPDGSTAYGAAVTDTVTPA